jgi:hypothetical protein
MKNLVIRLVVVSIVAVFPAMLIGLAGPAIISAAQMVAGVNQNRAFYSPPARIGCARSLVSFGLILLVSFFVQIKSDTAG